MSGIATALVITAAALSAQPYHWPLELPPVITSSFGEYRSGRFHAGIDLRTGGIGKNVYAADNGYVSRVRCSPWGYGKAVYLQLDDGNTVVYAHLDDYSDELREYVRQQQHAQESYTVDLYLQADQFPVARGQLIAKSGDTGVGAPHLHYEIRDGSQRPINPRKLGITWPDVTRPRVDQVLVAPHPEDGVVGGDVIPRLLPVENLGGGRYRTAPISAAGRIGVAVDLVDPGDGGYKLGIHYMAVEAGGEEFFRLQHDLLDYGVNQGGAVAYHPYFLDTGRFLTLWRWPGNRTPSYAVSPGDGWFDAAAAGEDGLEVRIVDFLENESTLTIPLLPGDAQPTAPQAKGTGSGELGLDVYGNALMITTAFTAPEPETPQVEAAGEAIEMRRVGAQTFRGNYIPQRSGILTVDVSHPRLETSREFAAFVRSEGSSELEMSGLRLKAAPDTPFGVLLVQAEPVADAPSAPVPMRGQAYRLWPTRSPLDAALEISLPMPDDVENPERVDVYRSRGGGWSRLSTRREGDRLVASTGSTGTFAVLEDQETPRLWDVLPAEGYHATTQRPYVRAKVSDAGSGVSDWRVTVAGQWLLVSYDPESSQLEWVRDEPLPPGEHTVRFEIRDAAGNETVLERRVVVPE